MNDQTPTKILEVLYYLYDKQPTGVISTKELANTLKISVKEAQGGLIYLKDKNWIKSFQRFDDQWVQKINADGIDELEKIKGKSSKLSFQIDPVDDHDSETLLHIEPQLEKTNNVDVFVSHRFVKSDIELATTLQNILGTKNLNAYLAERQRDYGKHLSEKIKENIEKSKCLVAIITENSKNAPSIHQEIGYALGLRIPVIILVEEDEAPGVLVKGVETELFKRRDFEKHCKIVLDHIPMSKKEIILNDEEKHALIDNVYRPCYNKLEPIFRNSDFITSIPKNPWNEIEPYWKRKTDSEIKDLFEEYEVERNKWHYIWIEFANKFNSNKKEIASILEPIFKKFNFLNEDGTFTFGDRTQDIVGWLQNCMDVIFNNEIQDEDELYHVLKDFTTKHWGEKHGKGFDVWKKDNPLVFVDIFYVIPEMVKELNANHSYQEIDFQRNLLRAKINFIIDALEKKL